MLSTLLLMIGLAHAEDAWTTEVVDLYRWPGATSENPVVRSVVADTQVEVVLRDGDRVRVRAGGDFGWVDADTLTDVEPEVATPETGGLLDGLGGAPGGLPPMNLGGAGAMGGVGGGSFGGGLAPISETPAEGAPASDTPAESPESSTED